MRTRSKIQIDRAVGQPLAFGANLVARLVGRLWRRDHSIVPAEVRRIVVAKFVGMGSILQATPLLRALRAGFPEARIVFVTAAGNRGLIEHLAGIDEARYVDDRNLRTLAASSVRVLLALARSRVDLYFDLEVYSGYASIFALASLARKRLGYFRTSARFKQGLYTHLIYFNTHRPVGELYRHLALAAGLHAADDQQGLGPLRIEPADREAFARSWRELAGADAAADPIVVNPNASDLLPERRWPAGRFVEAIEELVARGHPVALIGGRDEAPYVGALVERLSPACRKRVTNTAGRLSFGELVVLLAGARCVVTNDTGPMHMAIALGRPTVCLFGPGDPAHYGVSRPDVAILYRGVFCSPCLYHTDEPPCAGNNLCMQSIETSEVLAAVDRLLGAGGTACADAVPARPGARVETRLRTDAGSAPPGLLVRDSVLTAGVTACPVCAGRRFEFRFQRHGLRFVACSGCGLERSDPAPSDEELARIYGQHYYDAWGLHERADEVRAIKQATFRVHVTRVAAQLEPGASILDCGAATGFLMDVAAEAGLEAYGVELSEYGAAEIAKRFGADHAFQGELEQAAFAGRSGGFAALFMLDYLEHVRDPVRVLRRAHELLRPDGLLVITTPDTGSLTRRLMGSRWSHYKPEHLFYLSRRNLASLLEKTGFRVVRSRAARKALTPRYIHHQMQHYRHPLLSPLDAALWSLLPERLRDRLVSLSIGEMALDARRVG